MKVVNSDPDPVTLGDALMACSADKSRLIQPTNCDEIKRLMTKINQEKLKNGQTYFVGLFAFDDASEKSYRNWDNQNILDSSGRGTFAGSSGSICSMGSQDNLPSNSGDEAFVVLNVIDRDNGEIIVENFHQTDYSLPKSEHGYICEKEGIDPFVQQIHVYIVILVRIVGLP